MFWAQKLKNAYLISLRNFYYARPCLQHSNNLCLKEPVETMTKHKPRMNLKKRAPKIASNFVELKIISNGYLNGSKACVLSSSDSCFLINCGEGTTRGKLKTSRVENILLTRLSWDSIAGLNSVTSEMPDNLSVTMHAPFEFLKVNRKLTRFIFEKNTKIRQHNYKKQIFEDHNVKIELINLKEAEQANPASVNTHSYSITLKKELPLFNVQVLDKYNLEPGNWIKKLKDGLLDSITLDDGTVLKAEQLLDFSKVEEKKVLFLDVPGKEFVRPLVESIDQNDAAIKIILHMSNSDIINSPDYLAWIREFANKNCIHVMLDEQYPTVDLEAIYEQQAQLNLVSEQLFPLLETQNEPFLKLISERDASHKQLQREMKIVYAKNNMKIVIKPELAFKMDEIVNMDLDLFRNNIFNYYESEEFKKTLDIDADTQSLLDQLKDKIGALKQAGQANDPNEHAYPKVLFLGTSSAIPTK